MTLSDRVALVTGGGRGIGRAIAIGLARAGARVAVLARSADELMVTAAAVEEQGAQALTLPADVTDQAAVARALDAIVSTWRPVEILVNNAAVVWPLGQSATVDPDEWTAALSTNVAAAARLSFAVLPGMLEAGWGRIANVSSSVAGNPAAMVRANAYATNKAALEAHTVNLAAELSGTGVTVNAFRPGSVDTAMQAWIRSQDPARIGAGLHERFVANHERGRLLTPERSAATLLAHLASDQTGAIWDAAG